MISDFDLIGLSREKSVTCAVIGGSENIFWPKVEMSQDRFDAFWKYYIPSEKYIAKIDHDGLTEDGIPKNGRLIEIVDGN